MIKRKNEQPVKYIFLLAITIAAICNLMIFYRGNYAGTVMHNQRSVSCTQTTYWSL